ncbi:MAG: HEAT repeat domain-containing protein [Planctomycetaceae bacterium]|nr:HEAT repeat domain-containing protein [Planctomycetaceae bacterium]
MIVRTVCVFLAGLVLGIAPSTGCIAGEAKITLDSGDKVVLIGNTLAERMQHFGHWETLLHSRFPDQHLVVRNLGWSADTITTRLRSLNFQDHGHTLLDHQPDVILAFFGFNESFAGPSGLEQFQQDLATFITDVRTLKYPHQTFARGGGEWEVKDGTGQAMKTPQLVLISPIANENLPDRHIFAADRNNENLRLYTDAMRNVAATHQVPFVDLFTPTQSLFSQSPPPLTINGCHLNAAGDARVAAILDVELFGVRPKSALSAEKLAALQAAVQEKNLQHWYDFRAVNGYYIYGDRKAPFGIVNFPAEFAKLRNMVARRDEWIWSLAQGQQAPSPVDDSDTGEFVEIETNFTNEVHITSPEEALQQFTLRDGFEIQLVASEVDFPDLKNPVQMTFDARGRLWVTTMESYPMYTPGTPVNDKVLIFEDVDRDGRMDKQTVFADGLHVPTGIELGDGGAYVAAQPDLMFLPDADGDDRADEQRRILHGFDSGDSHHSISAFEWGPGGELYFQEGTFHHSQIETPYGPQRLANAGIFRYEPRTDKLSVFVSYSFANPWGHVFDRWGQDFVADASGGANYFAAAFSGDVDFPRKHPNLKQFLVKQWRPTAGCEFVSSRNFPEDMQGDYLLNNCIGFQGVLQYRMRDDGSGFAADPVEPLLRSSDLNFRPVDLQFGPDGALYLIDWFNPLIGHMQHSIRDPIRDTTHGRIWRVVYTGRPLVEPALIAGQPIPVLLDLLKAYEDRTRYRVRRELRERPTAEVVAAVDQWTSGLKADDPQTPPLKLEALWVKQHHDVVDSELLNQLLQCGDYRVRAAATRVLCYWSDRIDDPLLLLQARVNDDHPRVRLEAVRALSFFRGPEAQAALDIAAEVLLLEMDEYLDYTLTETNATLEGRLSH